MAQSILEDVTGREEMDAHSFQSPVNQAVSVELATTHRQISNV